MACDGNEIDTMFVDRRRDGGPNGQTLVKLSPLTHLSKVCHVGYILLSLVTSSFQVICCEGNAGFYEVGCMNTPLEGEQLSHKSHKFPCQLPSSLTNKQNVVLTGA